MHLRDGKITIPDFKVKGALKVIEVFGDFTHSQAYCEPKGYPEYKWNAEAMIAAYADVGYHCLVVWQSELNDPARHSDIKASILAFVALS